MALQPYPAPKPVAAKPATKAPDLIGGAIKGIGGLLGGLIKPPAAPTTQQKTDQQAAFAKAFPTLGTTGYPLAAPMGVQAKAPAQNIKPPVSTIAASQVKTAPTKVNSGTNTQAPAGSNVNTGGITPNGTVVGADGGASLNVQNQTTAPTQQPTQAGAQNTPSPYTVNGGLYGQLITGLANRGQQSGKEYTDAMGNYNQIADQIKQSQMNEAQAEANNRLNPIPIGDQTGREAVLRNQYGQQQTALGSRLQASSNVLGAANTQQGLQQNALQNAAGFAAPTQLTPGNYLQSPLGGGAATSGEGQQQGLQSATNWAIAQQNIQQGRTYQGQAQDISNSLQLLQTIRPQLSSFMEQAGLNPATAPVLNQQINKIDAQANPAAYRTMTALVAEARSFVQQMLQAQGGMTPTDAGNLVSSYDFGSLTPTQMNTFLQNMEVAGNYRLSQAQSASQAGYGANTQIGAAAQGADAQGGTLQTGGANQLNGLPDWLKVLGGLGSGVAGAAANTIQGAAGNAVAGGVGGVAGGLAEKVLGI